MVFQVGAVGIVAYFAAYWKMQGGRNMPFMVNMTFGDIAQIIIKW